MATRNNKKIGKPEPKKLIWLRDAQKERARQLKNTGLFCNLRPNKSKKACKECPYYDECFHLKWERDFLNKQASKKEANRRRRKQDNPKRQIELEPQQDEEDLEVSIKETSEDYLQASSFPCREMNFAGPDRKKCHFGKNCPW